MANGEFIRGGNGGIRPRSGADDTIGKQPPPPLEPANAPDLAIVHISMVYSNDNSNDNSQQDNGGCCVVT